MDIRQTHILIVDDSEDERNMHAYYLTRKGYRVSKALDGEEGLKKALALEPDIIVLDLWLPKISGWGVLLRLKSAERTKHIPVLIVTGDASVQPQECEGLLTKPCPPDELGAEVARRVRGHAARRSSGPPLL
jgi:DNA-binding response OmpR family regulator